MAYEEITSPIALDESFNTTENTSRNIADVLADELSNLADAVKPDAGDIALDTISGMSANNVQDGIEELKQSLDDLNVRGAYCFGLTPFTTDKTISNTEIDIYSETVTLTKGYYTFLYYIQASWSIPNYQFKSKIQIGSAEVLSSIDYATPVTNVALPFAGNINIPADGTYTLKIKGFTTNSVKEVTAKAYFTSALMLNRIS